MHACIICIKRVELSFIISKYTYFFPKRWSLPAKILPSKLQVLLQEKIPPLLDDQAALLPRVGTANLGLFYWHGNENMLSTD